jgi:6-phosphogluconolactonase
MNHAYRQVPLLALTAVLSTAALTASASDLRRGAVYLMTNQTNNAVIAYERLHNGTLRRVGRFSTGGAGNPEPVPDSGDPPIDPLASQDSLVLSDNGRFLFAVNAGSHEISVFAVKKDRLELKANRFIGDLRPISVTTHGDLLYVLTDGLSTVGRAAASLVGFRIGAFGALSRLMDSDRAIAAGSLTDPAQVSFSPGGDELIVTDKLNSLIYTFPVRANGLTRPPVVTASSGVTPFGFAFDGRGHVIVSEAAGGVPGASTVSSYELHAGGALGSISAAIPNGQTAACWVAVTPDSRYAFVSNTGSGQVSSHRLSNDGRIKLIDGAASATGMTSGPIDLAVSRDGRNLYVHQAGRQAVAVFKIEGDGSLSRKAGIIGLPFGAQGITAY